AARLANAGLVGGRDALEGDLGLLHVMAPGAVLHLDASPGHLERQYYFKPYSCCGNALGPMAALEDLLTDVTTGSISSVHFRLTPEAARNVDHAHPASE